MENKEVQSRGDEIINLKSHAYDCLVAIEAYQKELQATNQKIAQLSRPPNPPSAEKPKEE